MPKSNPNTCARGWTWNYTSYNCTPPDPNIPVCRVGFYWNGRQCVNNNFPGNCSKGWVWSDKTFSCKESNGSSDCSRDEYWSGSRCYPNWDSGRCDNGWKWDWISRICSEDDDGGRGQSVCPSNYYWDGTQCTNTTPKVCADGYVLRGSRCVIEDDDNECPTDYYYNKTLDSCLYITSASCPTNYFWNGDRCAKSSGTGPQNCANGYRWISIPGTCIPSEPAKCASSNKYWNKQKCVKCPGNAVWNGVACAAPNPQPCLVGVWNGQGCV